MLQHCQKRFGRTNSLSVFTEKGQIPKNVYMVFEYLEYDLTGILGK